MFDDGGAHRRDDEARYRVLELIGHGLRGVAGKATSTRRVCSAAVAVLRSDDLVSQPVQVGPPLHEVVRVLHVLDELAAAPLLQLEGAGPDAAGAIARGGDVRGVDRREAGGEHQ
jgi:hypothetical protein